MLITDEIVDWDDYVVTLTWRPQWLSGPSKDADAFLMNNQEQFNLSRKSRFMHELPHGIQNKVGIDPITNERVTLHPEGNLLLWGPLNGIGT